MAARIKNRLGNAVFFITAPFWLHLLTLFTSCCVVHCQQLPFKYQQLQYKMLQQQQQQYEYQKHMQQLQQHIALQQQYKQQQQQQQHEQQKQLQSILPISVSQQQQVMLQQQQLKLQQQLEQQKQLEMQLKKQQQLEEHLQRQKVEEQVKKQKQLQKIQLLQQLKLQQQQQQEKYTTLSMPMLAMLQQQKQQQLQQQQDQMHQEQLFQQQQQKQKRQQQQQLEEQQFQRLQQQQQQQLSLQQEQLLQQYTTLPMSVTLQQLPQQQQQQHHHQQQDERPQIHEQFYPLLSSVLPTHTQMMQTSASLVVDDCDSSELMEEESSDFNSKASHEFYSQLVPSTTKQMRQKHLQPVHADDNTSGSSDIASSVEDIPYWRGLVDDEFVPTAAAIRAPIPVRTKEPPSTTPATTSTAASTYATASIITEAVATLTTEATSTSTAATTASGRPATPTARTATTTSIATARSTVVPKATEATTDTSTGGGISTEKPQKDRRPKTGKRRRKPPAIREPLAALEKEQKLYELRDKQRQEFVAEVTSAYRDKSYRRPYAQAKREQGTTDALDAAGRGNATGGRKSADLKNILKNSGGLSLSEILQQKNLSLDDLLKGKQTALLALQTTAATSPQNTQKETGGRLPKPKRRISSTTTTTTTAATSKELSSSEEVGSDNQKLAKNKLKLPMLQRLKLFGSSSRATASSGEVPSIGRHREGGVTRATSTSTTTSSTPTTKRLPIYRKRQPLLQRSTLKPLGLLKSTVAVTSPSPPLLPTTSTTSTTTTAPIAIKPSVPTLNSEQSEEEDFDEEDDDNDDNTEILTTTSAPKPTTTKVPTTSAKNEASSSVIAKIQTRFEKNPNTNIIDLDEQPRKSTETDNTAVTYAADEDLEDFFEESTTKGASYNNTNNSSVFYSTSSEHVTPRLDRQASPVRPSNDYDTPPYVDPVDDRTDLLELIEDRRSGNRLFKVLEQRNMTLDELIEHRKRGSSQLHLAMVVQNRSRFFPDKKVILRDDMDIVTAFENFPHFNLMNLKSVKPDEIKTDSQGSSYFTSIIDIEPTDEIYRNENKDTGSSVDSNKDSHKGPTYAQPQKSLGVFPPWRTFNLGPIAHTAQAAANQQPFFLPQSKHLLDSPGESSSSSISQELPDEPELFLSNDVNLSVAPVDIVEAIENEVERAHDLVDLELSGHGFKRSPTAIAASMTNQQDSNSIYGNMPAGIRSAIAASAAIVLTSLATFMVIFIVCRWKQHRQRKTNFMKTYNAMRTKLPMVATTSTSRQPSLRTNDIEDSSMVQSITEQHQQLQQSHAQQQQNQPTHLFRSSSSHSLGGVLGGMGVSSTSSLLSAGRAAGLPLARSSTSLTLSLTSTQENSSNAKLNTMDPNTQEMHDYLYDALRKSF